MPNVAVLEEVVNEAFLKEGWPGVRPILPYLSDAYEEEGELSKAKFCRLPWYSAWHNPDCIAVNIETVKLDKVNAPEWCFGIKPFKKELSLVTISLWAYSNRKFGLVDWREENGHWFRSAIPLSEMAEWLGFSGENSSSN